MLDLPLVEIKRLLKLMSQPSAACDDVDRLIEGELARVRTRIRSLRALEQQLSAQHSCCTTPPPDSRRVRHPARVGDHSTSRIGTDNRAVR